MKGSLSGKELICVKHRKKKYFALCWRKAGALVASNGRSGSNNMLTWLRDKDPIFYLGQESFSVVLSQLSGKLINSATKSGLLLQPTNSVGEKQTNILVS